MIKLIIIVIALLIPVLLAIYTDKLYSYYIAKTYKPKIRDVSNKNKANLITLLIGERVYIINSVNKTVKFGKGGFVPISTLLDVYLYMSDHTSLKIVIELKTLREYLKTI